MDFHCRYDIIVAGAGIAGIASAVAAARQGKKVALVEKQNLIGGLATSGLIFVYLPLCDGMGHQVTFGLAEEMLKRCVNYGPFDLPEEWGGPEGGKAVPSKRFASYFSPAGFTLELDKMLREAGVDLWLDTLVTDVKCDEKGKIASVYVSNMSGNGEISADCFIDATGCAALIRRAGGACYTDDNFVTPWWMQNAPGEKHYYFNDSIHIQTYDVRTPEFASDDPMSGKSHTSFTRRAWQIIREQYDKFYAEMPNGRVTNYPLHLPAMPQFRKIARIDAVTMLGDDQYGRYFEDSIGLYGDWRKRGFVWETPYGTLIPKDVKGVLAAGRCMGCKDEAWEVFRVIPAAAMTGEVSGIAASMCIDRKCEPADLDVKALQKELAKHGFKFHLADVGLPVR